VKRTQLSSVELTQGHVETLLKVLEYDGRVERLPASVAAMFASALNASKRENADEPRSKKVKKRKRDPEDDSDEDRERKRKKKSRRRSATISSDEENSSDERSFKSRSWSKKGRSNSRKDSNSEASDSEDDRKDRRRKRKKQKFSSDGESTDDRRSKKKGGRSKHSSPDSDGSESESPDDLSRAHSRISKKSKSRSIHSHSRSESPKLVEMDAIEAYVYRAIRPQNHNLANSSYLTKGREMGVEDMAWAHAPCVKCPQAEFCKEGGPVNASSCEYFPEWMDPVGFGRVPYVDEEINIAVAGGEADVNVEREA
jgi:DNA-directed RNA polymerase III subunit RPC6